MRWLAVAFAIALVVPAHAQSEKPPPKSVPKKPAKAAPKSAIEAVVGVAKPMGKVPAGTLVISAPLQSDAPATRARELALLLAKHVAGRLGPSATAHTDVVDLDTARRAARRVRAFVYLEPRIASGRLHLSADGYPVPRTVWARARASKPGPVKHAHESAPIDAEVRLYLEPIVFGTPKATKYDGADPNILALACGDLDGDGSSDLVTVTRSRVLRVRLAAGKVERVTEVRWSKLAPVAPVPMRDPLGFATIVGPSHLDVTITDRVGSVRLDSKLGVVRKLKGTVVPHANGTACTWIHDLLLGDRMSACAPTDPKPDTTKWRRSDARASSWIVDRQGQGRAWTLQRDTNAAFLHGGAQEQLLGRVGAQLAVGDLDQDGDVEVGTTLDVLARRHDALTVRTVRTDGTIEKRFRMPVPRGVEALAFCPPDGAGIAPIVLATSKQIWVLR